MENSTKKTNQIQKLYCFCKMICPFEFDACFLNVGNKKQKKL